MFETYSLCCETKTIDKIIKDALGSDFVRPSASISPVGVRTSSIACFATYSLIAWCLMVICLEHLPVIGFWDKSTALIDRYLLSLQIHAFYGFFTLFIDLHISELLVPWPTSLCLGRPSPALLYYRTTFLSTPAPNPHS